ncbi:Heat stress transcription factor A-1 [Acorus calamus]|uniref:Heat stress transcription factor A-1 n=1 Tax=Acorus calamus TaxID=4465 RepID=A0AAV9DLD6_ACOCL|nr:Heat stress transcription factor A-1 [Acorus calamus]
MGQSEERINDGDVEAPPQIPPFLSKCYDMVDDASTDGTVSWGSDGKTFVVWEPLAFSRDLLPRYFKHNNLSSFVRQLNTYGFHKVDSDRWEFANEGFIKNQKHLLKTIVRRKNTQGNIQLKQSQGKNASVGACVEVRKFGLHEEVEKLRRDRNVLKQELVKLSQHQEGNKDQLCDLRQRFHAMELHQQQMLSFMAMAVQSPEILVQLVQQNKNNRRRAETIKKRRLPTLNDPIDDDLISDGQIVTYQPPILEKLNPLLGPMLSNDITIERNESNNGDNNICSNVDTVSVENGASLMIDGIPIYLEADDYLEQFLDNAITEADGATELRFLDIMDSSMEFEPLEHEMLETSSDMDKSTDKMEHLASGTDDKHEST